MPDLTPRAPRHAPASGPRDPHAVDVLVLGAGLTGMAAASVLGKRALVLERDARPGGLVKTDCHDGYWFDHVLHLLYFADPDTERRISALLGDDLANCPPVAWVETAHGVVRYPFQMHLGGLQRDTLIRCLADLARVTFDGAHARPAHFEESLAMTFGRGMCETFLYPYNRKMWKRPLDSLAPDGFTWNITRPDFERVLRGAIQHDTGFEAYNAKGWYPRPPAGAPVRGMEVVARALAGTLDDLRLEHEVESIELKTGTVTARSPKGRDRFRFGSACLATIPLPQLVRLCAEAPDDLRAECASLQRNRVLSIGLSIRGPRPAGRGHWRYYADESLCFTRLIYLHEFDPAMAPPEGWGLMVEITERAEDPLRTEAEILAEVRAHVARAGALPAGCEIVDQHLVVVDPAYVVFTPSNAAVMERARAFLKSHRVTPLGRYGRWEYSSMAQCMRDGFAWGETQRGAAPPISPNTPAGELGTREAGA